MPDPANANPPAGPRLASMTGYARAQGQHEEHAWLVEARSVNNKGLDIRLRLPPGYEALEPKLRTALSQRFQRGSIQVSLSLTATPRTNSLVVNEALLAELVRLTQKFDAMGVEKPRLDSLLAVRGVIEPDTTPESDEAQSAREAAILVSAEKAFDALADARRAEGARLAPVIDAHVAAIDGMLEEIRALEAVQPEAIRARLKRQVTELLESGADLPEERLAQEAALIAVRADVREELDRLAAHVEAAHDLVTEGGAIGRRLDFLCQEFNREANTICSKSTDTALTRVGLALKARIDQMREQIQNLE